jgi:FMN phosphatase YigB (HAD superfamily)
MTRFQSAVFFDLDHTLISGPFGIGVWPALLDELTQKTSLSRDEIYRRMLDENETRQLDSSLSPVVAMDWDDMAAVVARRLGVSLEANVCALAAAHAAQSTVLDNGCDVLRELAAPHRALVVATKGLAKYQQPVLDALGLTPLFNDILTPDKHGGLKKDRAFWGDWPERARLCIMVGDRYDDDIEAPGGFGFKTVWKVDELPARLQGKDPFARALLYPYAPEQTTPADAVITRLDELPDIVRRLELMNLGFTDDDKS